MIADKRQALYDLYADYGGLIDGAEWDAWLGLFATECQYQIIPRENAELGLPAGLIFCDSRAVLEDRIMALREANKYNIHWDRHVIGQLRLLGDTGVEISVEAPFAVYQSDQEGGSRLFAVGLYRDQIVSEGDGLKFRDKTVLLDTFAIPSLLATPL
jgi:anthranilate 1,2-dioxygenase small subunit